MHDQKKEYESQISDATKRRRDALIAEFRAAYDEVFALKNAEDLSANALKKVDVLLSINPELYTIFNYRRRILANLWGAQTADAQMDAAVAKEAAETKRNLLVSELKFNAEILKADYKVYSAWLHRRWLMRHLDTGTLAAVLIKERKQCEAILTLDKRNFHAWGYRRWVMAQQDALEGIDTEKRVTDYEAVLELDALEDAFTQAKIQDNFSNYSAWHSRTIIFEKLAQAYTVAITKGADGSEAAMTILDRILGMIEGDVELAIKAFFCDAEDQSTWLYMNTLLQAIRNLVSTVAPLFGDDDGEQLECLNDAYAAAITHIIDCCTTLIKDAIATAVANNSGLSDAAKDAMSLFTFDGLKLEGLREGTNGVKWPSWLLYTVVRDHEGVVPYTVTNARQLLATLYVVDAQRRGYYLDAYAAL